MLDEWKDAGKKKTIDSNLRKTPDSSGTSTGVNFLWVRLCSRLLVTFSNNFAVGHITGTPACVQTTCMLIRAETEPPGILLGWRHWAAQPSVKAARPMTREGAGRLRHNHNKPLVSSGAHFPSTHDRTCGAEEPGSFTAQHEIQGAAQEFEAGPTHKGADHHSDMYLLIPSLLWVSVTHGREAGDVRAARRELIISHFLLFSFFQKCRSAHVLALW